MSITEKIGVMTSIDDEGNKILMYPVTKKECVDGIEDIEEEIAVERARINNMAKLQEGSTTGDAELTDGRVDYNGNVHTNIGEHIREVSSQLSGEIVDISKTNINIPVYSVIENASIQEEGGRIVPFTSVVRHIYTAKVSKLETITVSNGDVYAFYVAEPIIARTSYNDLRYVETLKDTVITVPDGVGYIAVRSASEVLFTSQTPLQKEVMEMKEVVDGLAPFAKKPHDENRIYFTVSVNQNSYDREDDTMAEYNTVGCVLQLPSNYDNTGDAVPLVMACHGTGGYVTTNAESQLSNWDYFYNNGFAVFDVNGSVENSTGSMTKGMNMGSPRTVQAYFKAYEYIVKNYNVMSTIFVTGRSMGGLPALNFARSFPQVVRAIGLCYPVTDMYNQAWLNPWLENVRRTIASEFSFDDTTGKTYEADKIAGYNPALNGLTVDTKKYVFMNAPIKIWHGNADTTVDYNGSVEYVEAVKNAGGVATIRIMDGVGHEMASGESVYNLECVQWFNRFKN